MITLYAKSQTPISWTIRFLTYSPWSHVGVLEPGGEWVNEARYPRCRRVKLKTFLDDNDVVQPKEERCPCPNLAVKWMRKQTGYDPQHPNQESVGLPYDSKGIVGFLFHRNWTEPDSWFCSEFRTMAFLKGGEESFMFSALNRITPFLCWILPGKGLPPLKGKP